MPVSITPMIDVVFLLVIFFMTTAKFARETRADLDLPLERGEQLDRSEEQGLVVNVLVDGSLEVLGDVIDEARLRTLVLGRVGAAGDDPVALTVRADRAAAAAHVNRVVDLLSDLGVQSIRVATEVP